MTSPRVGLLAGALLFALAASALEVPYLAGRVNDLADLLPDDAEQRIESRLERLEASRGAQVAVLTIPSLEGDSLEDFSLRVVETWKLGREDADDGVLLLIARDDRKMRLEIGYGLEPVITDLASGRILDHVLRPSFQQGDFAGGVERAVEAIAGLIEGDQNALPPPVAERRRTSSGGGGFGFLAALALFSLMAAGSRGCAGWALFLLLAPIWFAVPLSLWGTPWGLVPGILWLVGFPIAWSLLGRYVSVFRGGGGGGRWSSGGGWGGFSGGGFSGGGFSGGGGSFGGGGASGSW